MKSSIATFDVLMWDDDWNQIVSDVLIADFHMRQWDGDKMSEHNRLDRECDRAQAKYEKFAVEYPICKIHAERLLANLTEKFTKFEFAAHEVALHGGWALLARKQSSKKPPTATEWDNLNAAAGHILAAVEKKYPAQKSAPPTLKSNQQTAGCGLVFLILLWHFAAAVAVVYCA